MQNAKCCFYYTRKLNIILISFLDHHSINKSDLFGHLTLKRSVSQRVSSKQQTFSKQKTGVSLIENQYLPGLLMSCPGLLHVKF